MRNRFAIGACMALSLLVGCPLIAGCSGTSTAPTAPDVSNATESESPAEEAGTATVTNTTQAEDEATGGLTEKDVLGVWKVVEMDGDSSSLTEAEDKGLFTCYKFKKGGKLVMSIQLFDTSLDREGTYEIRNGKLYVSAPSYNPADSELSEITDGPIQSIEAPEIKDAEVPIKDGYLINDQISSNGKKGKAKKITNAEYKQLVKKVSALGPQKIAVGEEVVTDNYSFTINSLTYMDEVYPSDTSGYYSYYEHQEGKSYLVADVSYTNLGTEYCVPGYSTSATMTVGENKYDASVEVDGGSNMFSSYRIEAKDSGRLYIFATIPDAARESGEAKLTWSIPKDTKYMNTYYQSSFPSTTYVISAG